MENLIIIGIVVLILALATGYVVKSRKSGKKCIGCPSTGCSCNGGCNGCSGCGKNF